MYLSDAYKTDIQYVWNLSVYLSTNLSKGLNESFGKVFQFDMGYLVWLACAQCLVWMVCVQYLVWMACAQYLVWMACAQYLVWMACALDVAQCGWCGRHGISQFHATFTPRTHQDTPDIAHMPSTPDICAHTSHITYCAHAIHTRYCAHAIHTSIQCESDVSWCDLRVHNELSYRAYCSKFF